MLDKITNIGTGFTHKPEKIFKAKSRAYVAKGFMRSSEIPDNITALLALYEGANAKFLPFGTLDNSGSNITWTQKTAKTDFYTIGLGYEVVATIIGLTLSPEMLDFVTNIGDDEYTFLFIPDGTEDIFMILNGVTVTTEGNIGILDGDNFSKITFKMTKEANKLTDVVKFVELEN